MSLLYTHDEIVKSPQVKYLLVIISFILCMLDQEVMLREI